MMPGSMGTYALPASTPKPNVNSKNGANPTRISGSTRLCANNAQAGWPAGCWQWWSDPEINARHHAFNLRLKQILDTGLADTHVWHSSPPAAGALGLCQINLYWTSRVFGNSF
jgi:hypothetical protein